MVNTPTNNGDEGDDNLPFEKMLKSWQVKKIFNISETTLKRYRKQGILGCKQAVKGGNYRYHPADVRKLMPD